MSTPTAFGADVIDLVDVIDAEHMNNVRAWLVASAFHALASNTETLTGDVSLLDTDDPIQFLDPGGSSRTITLPAAATTNHVFVIANMADAAEKLTVQNDAITKIDDISKNEAKIFVSAGTYWVSISSGRNTLDSNTTFYVGHNLGEVTLTIASPAVATLTDHGLSVDDRIVFQVPKSMTACTISEANPGVITMTNDFVAGRPVLFRSTGFLPIGIVPGTTYYVLSSGLSTSSFQIGATPGGAALNTTQVSATFTNGSSTITIGTNHNLQVGQIIQFAGTSVVNFSNATDYYVKTVPSSTTITVTDTPHGSAITAGVVTSDGTIAATGTHYCETAGSLPTGVTAGTQYYVGTVPTSDTFTLSTTAANANPVNTSGSVTGSPIYTCYTGSNSNDGSADSIAGALLTPSAAVMLIASLDCKTYAPTVQLCDGHHYCSTVTMYNILGSADVTIQGNSTYPSNCIIDGGFSKLTVGSNYTVKDLRFLESLSTMTYAIRSEYRAKISFSNVEFDAGYAYHAFSANFGQVNATGNYKILGDASSTHLDAGRQSNTTISGRTITLLDVPSFYFFANSQFLSDIDAFSNTFVGSGTGSAYYVATNSVIFTNSGGAEYFPSNSAGSNDGTGIYG